jgi:enoyl-CoA hydratase/carnithine racemase
MPLDVTEPERRIVLVRIDNQPKRNAMSRAMLGEMAALWDRLDTSDCRCVILTGAGEKGFCAGADIGGDLSADPETSRVVNRAAASSFCCRRISALPPAMRGSVCLRCAMPFIRLVARR